MFNDVVVEQITYCGWEGAYRLRNSVAELVVVPALGGRVLSYKLNGSRNILWENEEERGKLYEHTQSPGAKWRNYGGYKLWVAPQDRAQAAGWRFGHDNCRCRARLIDDSEIRLTGAPIHATGTQFVTDLKLFPHSSRVRLRQRIRNVSEEPVRWGLSDVTQLATQAIVAFPRNSNSRFPDGVRFWRSSYRDLPQWQIEPRMVAVRTPSEQGKIGADSDAGWISYRTDDIVYVKTFSHDPTAEYPDEGCTLEVYTCPDYVQVEVLSPLYDLQPGDERVFTEEWSLQRVRREEDRTSRTAPSGTP